MITMDTYGHLFPASNDRAKLEAGRHRSARASSRGGTSRPKWLGCARIRGRRWMQRTQGNATPVFFARVYCPICRTEHEWFAKEAWVCEAEVIRRR